ncbi:hypothetical protein PM082_022163 [Marasmius tenuissimus]|nr:hypothetical protein PM082_022163 [Marasmius tenuissimus]
MTMTVMKESVETKGEISFQFASNAARIIETGDISPRLQNPSTTPFVSNTFKGSYQFSILLVLGIDRSRTCG